MISLDLPPKVWKPEAPQILRPSETGPYAEADLFLQRNGIPRSIRRAILSELERITGLSRKQRIGVEQDLGRFAGLDRKEIIRAGTIFLPFVGATSAPVFPSIVNTNSAVHAASSPFVVNLPASLVSGQLLMFAVTAVENGPTATPSGFTQLLAATGSSQITLYIFYKTSNGSEGSTVNVTTNGVRTGASYSWTVTDWQGTPEMQSTSHGTSATPDPASLTPSWGSDDILVLPILGIWGTQTISSYPTNYMNGLDSYQSSGLSNRVAWCRRALTASSEDPGVFTLSSTVNSHRTATVAIRGA